MIQDQDSLQYIINKVGKTILVIHDVDDKDYCYLIEEFKPANPSNHIHDNFVKGRCINGVIQALGSFSNGFSVGDLTLSQKMMEIPIQNFVFSDLKWIWFKGYDSVI